MMILLANTIMLLHLVIVAFVVGGFVAIWVGYSLNKKWARNFWFRVAHLALMGFIAAEAVVGMACPLTVWENQLRESTGGEAYEGGFIAALVHSVMFYDLPLWVFTFAYAIFFVLVGVTFYFVPPRWPWGKEGEK